MRIGFIDHSYHQKTRSSEFFKRAFLDDATVDEWWDDRWRGGPPVDVAAFAAHTYDLVIVWQDTDVVPELLAAGLRDFVFVPMWDSCTHLKDEYWRKLAGVRVLSFSRTLHEKLERLGVPSLHMQYWPDPAALPALQADALPRGFFWQRRREVQWGMYERHLKGFQLDSLHLHLAQDPNCEVRRPPRPRPTVARRYTTSDWFPSRADYLATMATCNIYFAPRHIEGIGFSFLEAMAMGLCVVAPDVPTMNEYVTDGVNGILLRPGKGPLPRLADFSALGARARQDAQRGHLNWHSCTAAVRTFLFTPTHALPEGIGRFTPTGVPGLDTPRLPLESAQKRPLVTVAVVTLNCAATLQATLDSISGQNWPSLEVVVVDGGSTDATLDILRRNEQSLDTWVSEPDSGPYDAMNKAAAIARGEWIVFLHAGDWFAGNDAITRAMSDVPADAGIVIGHHVYVPATGGEHVHRIPDMDITWHHLQAGRIDRRWLQGVPCHQATFTRTALLHSKGYDTAYRYAADHDFLFRQRLAGTIFHHCGEVIAVYTGGGLSARHEVECIDEWRRIAAHYGHPRAARRLFAPLKAAAQDRRTGRSTRSMTKVFRLLAAGSVTPLFRRRNRLL